MKKIIVVTIAICMMQNLFAQQKPILKITNNGIFIFCGNEIPASWNYSIERKMQGETDFSPLTQTYLPSNINAFTGQLMQWNATCPFYEQPTNENIRKAFAMFQTHNIIDSIFYFNSLPLYLYASGNAFLDVNVQEGKSYIYRIKRGDDVKISDAIIFKKENLKIKTKLVSKAEFGNKVQLKWHLKIADKSAQPHVAKVFRSDNLQTPLHEINALCGFQFKGDSLFAIVNDTVVSSKFYYSYCIKMFDKFGNESAMSDTVSLLNKFENTLPVVYLYTKSNATKNAIDLKWNFGKITSVRSIEIFRSTEFDTNFELIHSATDKDSTYSDINVQPIISYYYFIKLNGVFETGNKSATVSGMLKTEHQPAVPQHISSKIKDNVIELSWKRLDPSTRGYYVFRGLNYHPKSMQQVSGLIITDSLNVTFMDTTDLSMGKIYSYCVKAVSVDYTIGKAGDTTSIAFMKNKNATNTNTVDGIFVKQIGNYAKIVWARDTVNTMLFGVNVLRREILANNQKSDWKKIVGFLDLKNHSSYIDSTIKYFQKYEYSLQYIYGWQVPIQSAAVQFELEYEKPIPPVVVEGFYTGTSILLRWGNSEISNLKSYKIYRNENNDNKLIGTIDAKQNSFEDKNIAAGKSYDYYIIVVDTNNVESNKSSEVGVTAK